MVFYTGNLHLFRLMIIQNLKMSMTETGRTNNVWLLDKCFVVYGQPTPFKIDGNTNLYNIDDRKR